MALALILLGGKRVEMHFPTLDKARKWIFGEAQKQKVDGGSLLELKSRAGTAVFELSLTALESPKANPRAAITPTAAGNPPSFKFFDFRRTSFKYRRLNTSSAVVRSNHFAEGFNLIRASSVGSPPEPSLYL